MPVPQKINFLVEQAEKPVHKRLTDNGATYEFRPTRAISFGIGSLAVLIKILPETRFFIG